MNKNLYTNFLFHTLAGDVNEKDTRQGILPCVLWERDEENYELQFMSGDTEAVFGYSRQVLMEKPFLLSDVKEPADQNRELFHLKTLYVQGEAEFTYTIELPDGRKKHIYERARIIGKGVRDVPCIQGISVDITGLVLKYSHTGEFPDQERLLIENLRK